MAAVLNDYTKEFSVKGVQVALCKCRSHKKIYRWLEFIDRERISRHEYIPQYDISNLSGQRIQTKLMKLDFPNGVAIEQLDDYGKGRKNLLKHMPRRVERMMTKKGLLNEYQALVYDLATQACTGTCMINWSVPKLEAIARDQHEQKFEAKGVSLFVCHRDEYVQHGAQYGGHHEHFRWIEFVDRNEQPNYVPQRDIDDEKEICAIM